jgi:signal transduction histidine kinase
MKEVSCILLDVFFDSLKKNHLPPDILCAGLPYDLPYLRNKNERIEWDVFCKFMANAGSVWSEEELADVGASVVQTRLRPFIVTVAKYLLTTTDLYTWWNSPFKSGGGKQVATCIIPTVVKLGKNHLRITLEIQSGYKDCPEFFMVTKGGLAFLPMNIGADPSAVEMHKIDRGAVYDIHYTEAGGAVSRVRHIFTWPFDARIAARELNEAHEELVDRYRQLEEAKEQVQRQSAELEAAFRARQLMQEEFSRMQIESQEAERKRLASELHDGLGQNLLVVGNELQQFLIADNGRHEELQRVAALVQESIESAREISSNLHPHHLERLGFRAAVEAMAGKVSHSAGITVDCSFGPAMIRPPKDSEIHLYRIIQEALANVVRHSSASRATIEVRNDAGTLDIIVRDNGCGFSESPFGQSRTDAASLRTSCGFGLASMRERARIIGGQLIVESVPSSGTTIHLRLPLS